MSRVWRAPVLVLLAALLVVGVAVEARDDDTSAPVGRLSELTATAAPAGTLSTTWFCAAGSATGVASGEGAGPAEQVVVVTNASDADSSGTATFYPVGGAPTAVPVTVAAHTSTSIRVSDHVKAEWAAAMVEVTGGEVTVAHQLTGPTGRSISDCASSPGAEWYFPGGTTRVGTSLWLALFNPFPGEATVDLSFDTSAGTRTPEAYQGIVVPGGAVVVEKVSDRVTLSDVVATTVSVRSGRVVAEQIQSLEGREGDVTGLAATIGATAPSPIWTFPAGAPAGLEAAETVSVFNPGDTDTQVLVQVQLDDPATNGTVEPFEVSVPAHRVAVVQVVDPAAEVGQERFQKGLPHWVLVTTPDGSDVVAQRSLSGGGANGFTTMVGLPVVATRWLVPLATASATTTSQLSIANPSPSETATVSLRRSGDGAMGAVPEAVDLTVAPGQRLVIDLLAAGFAPGQAVEVTSDVPVVVGQWLAFSEPVDVASPLGVPVEGTQSLPTAVVGPSVADEQLSTDELAPTETFDQGSVETIPGDSSSTTTTTVAAG